MTSFELITRLFFSITSAIIFGFLLGILFSWLPTKFK